METTTLLQSYLAVKSKVVSNGCVWVRGENGWYQSFDEELVAARVQELKDQIAVFRSR